MSSTVKKLSPHYNNKYVVFDVESKKVSKLKKKFVIPAEDTIIAYYEPVKLPVISGVEIVFTDRALYTLVGRKKPLRPSGIGFSGIIVSYDQLCCYLVSYDELQCVLFNYDKDILVCKKPLLMKMVLWDEARKSVTQLMQFFQQGAIENDCGNRLSYQKAKQAFRFIVEESIEKCIPLDRAYYKVALEADPELIIQKYKLYINDFDISHLNADSLTADEERVLLNYIDHYIRKVRSTKWDVTPSVCHYRVNNLKVLCSEICTNSITKKLFCYRDQFIAYNSIRENPFLSLNTITERHLGAFSAQTDRGEFIKLAAFLRCKNMAILLEGLMTHSIGSIKEWNNKSDIFGLDALHYAIITHNEDAVIKGIKLYDSISKQNLFLDRSDQTYDYAALAFLMNSRDLGDFLLESTGEIAAVRKRIKNMERLTKLHEYAYSQELHVYTEGNKWIREAKRNVSDTKDLVEKFAQGQDRVNLLKKHLESSKDMIEDLKAEIGELREQIENQKKNYYASLPQKVKKIKKSPLYQFYINPEFLLDYLKTIDQHLVIYEVDGKYNIDIDVARMDDLFREDSKYDYGKKPYGDSWFSPEAHRKYNVLKKEYRQYAKVYHPDNVGGSVHIFNEIGAERDSIIEGLI